MGKYDSNPVIEGRYDAYGRKTYWSNGFTGKGVKVAVIDNYEEEHGHQMASVGAYIAPGAEVLRLDMKGDYYRMRDCFRQAITVGANIISCSRSVDFDTKDMHDAVKACRAAGIAMFCSAGNTGDKFVDTVDIKRYPAAYPETISVLCIDNTFAPSVMSSHGTTGTITGFGQNVLVRNKNGDEMLVSGTSPTTAAYAFVSALWHDKIKKEAGRSPTPDELDSFIKSSSIDMGAVGKDNITGLGFFTLDKSEYERVKLMMLDANNNGLSDRVERIKSLMASGVSYEEAERRVSKDYFVIGYETLSGVAVPIYGGRKPNV